MLAFPFDSVEAGMIRAVASTVTRRRFTDEAILFGQIGVDMAPCDGGCHFCAFAKPHTTIQPSTLGRVYGLGSVFAKTMRDSRRAAIAVAAKSAAP